MADNNRRLVYSTDNPDEQAQPKKKSKAPSAKSSKPAKATPPLAATNRTVYVERDRKGRGGKTVTVVSNLQITDSERESLQKELKTQCGAGGALKEGNLELQGDHRDKVMAFLQGKGHTVKAKGG